MRRADYRPPWRRKRRRPWAPGDGPANSTESSLFPGGNVRLLTSAPDWAFTGPNKLPTFPGDPTRIAALSEHGESKRLVSGAEAIERSNSVELLARQENALLSPVGPLAAIDEFDERTDAAPLPSIRREADASHENDMTGDPSITFDETVPDNAEAIPEIVAPRKGSSPSGINGASRSASRRRTSFIPRVAEWLGIQPAIEAAQRERKQARKAAKVAFQVELAAGREPDRPQSEPRTVDLPLDLNRATGPNSSLTDFSLAVARPRSTDPPPDRERHSRLCSICSHPDRDAIEADYLHWRNPAQIAERYGLPNIDPIYRHARATGLVHRRKTEVCRVMERYLEKVDSYTTDEFDQVTRAVRAYTHIDTDGRWFEPSRTNYILTGQIPSVAQDAPQPSVPSDEITPNR